jgi:hypothetical protein
MTPIYSRVIWWGALAGGVLIIVLAAAKIR